MGNTRVGTCNFKTFKHAVNYYSQYGFNERDVKRKVAESEIVIGTSGLEGKHINWDLDGRAYYIVQD
jgi:hypothetical protein